MRRWTWLLVVGWLSVATAAAQEPVGRPPTDPFKGLAPVPVDAVPDGAIARLGSGRLRNPFLNTTVTAYALVYSPDGKYLAGTDSRTVVVWDASTGRPLRQIGGGIGPGTFGALSLTFAPDSRTLAVCAGNQVRMWDVATGGEGASWPVAGAGAALRFSSDGRHLASLLNRDPAVGRPTITFWDPTTGTQGRQTPVGEPSNLLGAGWLALAPDGRALAAALPGGRILLVEAATGEVRAALTLARSGPSDSIPPASVVAFAPDSRTLYATTPDGTVIAWDTATGRERRVGPAAAYTALSLSADGRLLAVRAATSGGVRLYETSTGRTRQHITEIGGFPLGNLFALSPDGATLAALAHTGGLRFWDTATGRERQPGGGHTDPVTQLAFAPDGRTLLSLSAEQACVWDVTAHRLRTVLEGSALWVRQPVLAHDGRRLAVVDAANNAAIIEVPGGRVVRQIDDLANGPYGLALTADGSTLAVSEGPAIKLWDLASGSLRRTVTARGTVAQLAFSADGQRLAGVGSVANVQVWEAGTGRRLWERFVPATGRSALVFSPDGARLACASSDGRVYLFDTVTGKELRRLEGHGRVVPPVAFAPDGTWLVTGGADQQVFVWEIASDRLLHTLSGHLGAVESLAFSPDGKLLASGGADASVLLWDMTKLGLRPEAVAPEQALTDDQMTRLWDELADANPGKAYSAIRTLVAVPRAGVVGLRARLKPAVAADRQRLAQLLADLDNDAFDRREAATRELAARGEEVRAELEKFLADTTSAEVRQRAQGLLKGLSQMNLPPEVLRQVRAVEVLERIGTSEARAALDELAKGLDGARLTREARAALERLKRQ